MRRRVWTLMNVRCRGSTLHRRGRGSRGGFSVRLGGDGVTSLESNVTVNRVACLSYSTAFIDSTIRILLSFVVIRASTTPVNSSVRVPANT